MRSENISDDKFHDSGSKPDQQDDANWEERYAYSLGLQAYVWGFPGFTCLTYAGFGPQKAVRL